MKRRAWLLYLGVGYAVLLVWEFVPGLQVGPLFNAIAISSPIAILIAVKLHRPDVRAPWYLFALGQAFFVAGDVITYNYNRFFGTELPYPSIGDVLYLSVYPCLIAGLLLLIRRRNPGHDRDSLIDSLIVAIGLGTMQWVFIMSPTAHDSASTLLQKIVAMSYPFMDLMLVMAVVRLAIGAGKRTPSMYLMGAATLALFVTDTVYTYISAQGIVYNQSGVLEAGWGTFYLLWGAAALHPSMRLNSEEAPDVERRLSWPRLALLATASLMAPVVMAIQWARHETLDTPVLIGASAALFLLVVLRMVGLVRREEQAAQREKALRAAGAALVTATNRESIYEATITAARSLAGAGAAIRMLVRQEGGEDLTVVAASGGIDVLGREAISLSLLPGWKRERLESHRSLQVPVSDSQLAPVLGFPEDTEVVTTLPLFMKGELRGILVVASQAPLPRRVSDALSALVPQAALALDSAALTEDLVRRQSEARFSSLVQNSSDVVMVVDADSTIRYVSPSVERVLGLEPSSLEGTRLTALIHPEDKAQMLQFLMYGGREGDAHPALTECRMRHEGGFWLHVETLRTNLLRDVNVKGIVLNTRDVSERKAFEDQLAHQAFHDQVTGLANRALFKDRVEHALERQLRDDRPVSVLFMDLDDFKTINDSLGHDVGDLLLSEVGERVKGSLRAADTAARMGGDEFAVLLEDGGEGLGAADVATRILQSLDGAFLLGGKEVFVRASIGIATANPDHERPIGTEELLRNADVAMYMAKESGKNRYQIFEPAMHDTALRRLELKADLQRALDNQEFILHYQPIIELSTNQISGFEALLRWEHPVRGTVPPLDFIPLAEETGLIVQIGNWVLAEATRQGKALQQRYPAFDPPLHMAVNLSARQLQRPEIVTEVAEALMRSGLAPESLVLEITESVMMRDIELSLQRLTELKEIGVRLAVDDFGIGYSSLNYIQQFPVDILKVDKSFVDAVNTDARKARLTETIIRLAEDLELRPVAEGIERADQLEQLLRLHCDLGQGFYFARPLPMDGVDDLITARQTLASRDAELSS
jgi:diguanylate cyclase (GGDEF)-like protein/PAS domain S-box-containing protein